MKYDIIKSNVASDVFKPMRAVYQKFLHAILNQAKCLPPQITWSNGTTRQRLKRSQSIDDNSSSRGSKYLPVLGGQNGSGYNEFTENKLIFSRYFTEFIEIGKLGSGGFGSVYKAKNILDNNEYAIKKIHLRNESPEFCEKVNL